MPLDAQSKKMLDEAIKKNLPPLFDLPLDKARERVRGELINKTTWEKVSSVEEKTIPVGNGEILIRIYKPDERDNLPLLVYYHGGGWVVCDLDTHENVCRVLANKADCCVISVDYRMAPEHKFPAAIEDSYYALEYIYKNSFELGIDKDKIIVGGDSAGGNLAAAAALKMRDEGGPQILAQVLIYPVTDHYNSGTKSYEEYAEGYALDKAHMVWFWDEYLKSAEDADNPYASPNRAKSLRNLPKTFIITAEYDPLRDEAEEYARMLEESGNEVKLKRVEGVMHGYFLHYGILDKGKETINDVSEYLKVTFDKQ